MSESLARQKVCRLPFRGGDRQRLGQQLPDKAKTSPPTAGHGQFTLALLASASNRMETLAQTTRSKDVPHRAEIKAWDRAAWRADQRCCANSTKVSDSATLIPWRNCSTAAGVPHRLAPASHRAALEGRSEVGAAVLRDLSGM